MAKKKVRKRRSQRVFKISKKKKHRKIESISAEITEYDLEEKKYLILSDTSVYLLDKCIYTVGLFCRDMLDIVTHGTLSE